MAITTTGDTYTLHVQRANGKMSSNAFGRALNENFCRPERCKHMVGVVAVERGSIRKHGGLRTGSVTTSGGGSGGKQENTRYDEFILSVFGDEECTLDIISLSRIATLLEEDEFFGIIKSFGFVMQKRTFRSRRNSSPSTCRKAPRSGCPIQKRKSITRFSPTWWINFTSSSTTISMLWIRTPPPTSVGKDKHTSNAWPTVRRKRLK